MDLREASQLFCHSFKINTIFLSSADGNFVLCLNFKTEASHAEIAMYNEANCSGTQSRDEVIGFEKEGKRVHPWRVFETQRARPWNERLFRFFLLKSSTLEFQSTNWCGGGQRLRQCILHRAVNVFNAVLFVLIVPVSDSSPMSLGMCFFFFFASHLCPWPLSCQKEASEKKIFLLHVERHPVYRHAWNMLDPLHFEAKAGDKVDA